MEKQETNKKEIYRLNEFAKLLNVSTKTLHRWDYEGILKAKRTITNRRYYTYEQYLACLNGATKQVGKEEIGKMIVKTEKPLKQAGKNKGQSLSKVVIKKTAMDCIKELMKHTEDRVVLKKLEKIKTLAKEI